VRIVGVTFTPSNTLLFVNGVVHQTNRANIGAGSEPLRLGAGYTPDPQPAAVDLAEVLVYDRALTTEERGQLETALYLKYVDSDNNGLPDDWERAHFGQTGVDPCADADGDGYSNRLEYHVGTDPQDEEDHPDWPGAPGEVILDYSTNAPAGGGSSSTVATNGLRLLGPQFAGPDLLFSYTTEGAGGGVATNQAWEILWKPALDTNVAWQVVATFAPGQTNLSVAAPSNAAGFFLLGSGADADGDGLSDAVEHFIYRTNWQAEDSDGDGLRDDWELAHGLDPTRNDLQQTTAAGGLQYDALGRMDTGAGTPATTFQYDAEGNVQEARP
jgi:hypothetical protein